MGLKVIQKYFDTKLDMELQVLDLSFRLHSLDYQSTQRLKKSCTGFIRILVSHEIPGHLWGGKKMFLYNEFRSTSLKKFKLAI